MGRPLCWTHSFQYFHYVSMFWYINKAQVVFLLSHSRIVILFNTFVTLLVCMSVFQIKWSWLILLSYCVFIWISVNFFSFFVEIPYFFHGLLIEENKSDSFFMRFLLKSIDNWLGQIFKLVNSAVLGSVSHLVKV